MNNVKLAELELSETQISSIEELLFSNTYSKRQACQLLNAGMSNITFNQMMNMPIPNFSGDMSLFKVFSDQNVSGQPVGSFAIDVKEISTDVACLADTKLATEGVAFPSWTRLTSLPGLSNPFIEQLGLLLFKSLGLKDNTTPSVIASLKDNKLLNTSLEVNSVLAFLEKNTEKASPDNMEISFDGVFDNYKPQVRLYYTEKYAYLAVLEETGIEGRYIYAYERADLKISKK